MNLYKTTPVNNMICHQMVIFIFRHTHVWLLQVIVSLKKYRKLFELLWMLCKTRDSFYIMAAAHLHYRHGYVTDVKHNLGVLRYDVSSKGII